MDIHLSPLPLKDVFFIRWHNVEKHKVMFPQDIM